MESSLKIKCTLFLQSRTNAHFHIQTEEELALWTKRDEGPFKDILCSYFLTLLTIALPKEKLFILICTSTFLPLPNLKGKKQNLHYKSIWRVSSELANLPSINVIRSRNEQIKTNKKNNQPFIFLKIEDWNESAENKFPLLEIKLPAVI